LPKRVVIADNDDEWLSLIALDLKLEGHDVVAAVATGAAALASCGELRPDVLVVDHRMPPGPHGLAVAQALQTTQPELAIIVFSNYEDPALQRAVDEAGARFILKTNLRALRRAVSDA
jgi:CheY-like chemotaxis protein